MKLNYKIFIGALTLLLILGALTMFGFNKKPKVTETKSFSCPGMDGFTFEYPVFKGWEPFPAKMNAQGQCIIMLSMDALNAHNVNTEIAPQIQITKSQEISDLQILENPFPDYTNPAGINYLSFDNGVRFFLGGYNVVTIELMAGIEKYGFYKNQFFKTVIESFRLTNETYDYTNSINAIAKDIENLKGGFPQLKDFNASKNVDARDSNHLVIDYDFHTHQPQGLAGWRGGVPEPDDDGVWFYINFHDPDSRAQIDTQPVMPDLCMGKKKVTFLILEGAKTKALEGRIMDILRKNGITDCEHK